ncbi:MAG: N-acetyltransferase [Bacteroidales bacterium]|nr:N-acetyltransferase [Bacteroidales bacterium]
MKIVIKEVTDQKDLHRFIKFPDQLYKSCNYYIPAIHRNQFSTLSKEKNPAFEHCEARFWLAFSENEIVGRVAGIINHRYNQERKSSYMRFGWLDFIEDENVLKALMSEVEKWAVEKGLQSCHGPLGFTSFDASGVLIEGFDECPTSFGHYNFPYYDKMLLNAGYEKEVDWVEFNIKVPDEIPQKILTASNLISKRYSLRNAPLRDKKDIGKYAKEVFELLNTVYKDIYGFSTLTQAQITNLTKEFLSFLSPDYVSFILNEKDEMVAFGIVLPSLAKALKKARGKLYPFGFLHILYALHFNDTIDMLLIGVRPDYQNKGVTALIFSKIGQAFFRKGIKQIETNRELENNHKVQQLWAGYELRQHKRARCYIKSLK